MDFEPVVVALHDDAGAHLGPGSRAIRPEIPSRMRLFLSSPAPKNFRNVFTSKLTCPIRSDDRVISSHQDGLAIVFIRRRSVLAHTPVSVVQHHVPGGLRPNIRVVQPTKACRVTPHPREPVGLEGRHSFRIKGQVRVRFPVAG